MAGCPAGRGSSRRTRWPLPCGCAPPASPHPPSPRPWACPAQRCTAPWSERRHDLPGTLPAEPAGLAHQPSAGAGARPSTSAARSRPTGSRRCHSRTSTNRRGTLKVTLPIQHGARTVRVRRRCRCRSRLPTSHSIASRSPRSCRRLFSARRAVEPSRTAPYQSAWTAVPLCSVATVALALHAITADSPASCPSRPASAWRSRPVTRSTHRARRSSCRSAPSSGPTDSRVPALGDGVVQQRHIALAGMPLHPLAVAREDAISFGHVIRPHRQHDHEMRLSMCDMLTSSH